MSLRSRSGQIQIAYARDLGRHVDRGLQSTRTELELAGTFVADATTAATARPAARPAVRRPADADSRAGALAPVELGPVLAVPVVDQLGVGELLDQPILVRGAIGR